MLSDDYKAFEREYASEIQKAIEDAFLSQPQHMHIHITFEHGFIGGNL